MDELLETPPDVDAGAADAHPVLVLVGAYDTGKTSLLRRLLTDAGEDIPDWARVSAREETSTVNEVELLDCLVLDTPGLEGLSEWHRSATRDALLRADALLLLTTSNLFASGEEDTEGPPTLEALDIVSGSVFAPGGLTYPPGALAVVINRLDDATPDPTDFPDDYEATRTQKLQELSTLLERDAPRAIAGSYREAIASDPFGRTRNRIVQRDAYDSYRSWDRVGELEAWIRSLPAQLNVLRQWRDVRARAEALAARGKSLNRELSDCRTLEAQARSSHTEAERLVAACSRERAAAGARLTAALDRALFSSPLPTDDHFRSELQGHLQSELGQWAEHVAESLRGLAEATDANLPDFQDLDATKAAATLTAAASKPDAAHQALQTARKGVDLAKGALKTLAAVDHTGQPSVKDPGGWIPKAWIKPEVAAGVDQLLGIGGELLGLAEKETATRAADLQRQRERLAKEGSRVATQMFVSQSAPDGWEGLFEGITEGARQSAATWAALQAEASEAVVNAEASSTRIAELLSLLPQPL